MDFAEGVKRLEAKWESLEAIHERYRAELPAKLRHGLRPEWKPKPRQEAQAAQGK